MGLLLSSLMILAVGIGFVPRSKRIWVAAPAREWVHMWVQEEEDFDSQLFLDQGVAAL